MSVDQEAYQKEYDEAAAKLEADAQATTARGADGKFTKAEPEPAKSDEQKPVAEPEKTEEQDPVAELRARVEKAEKMAKDNQAFATRMAQEASRLRKEREAEQREKTKPAILDTHPELVEAVRYVVSDPTAQNKEADAQEAWRVAIEKAHPGIFDVGIDPDLEKAVAERFKTLGDKVQDPLECIREITEEKLAFNERQLGKRFAAEAAKQAKVSAMAVPGAGAGGGVRTPQDDQAAMVERMKNMSEAEFAREVRRVKGF